MLWGSKETHGRVGAAKRGIPNPGCTKRVMSREEEKILRSLKAAGEPSSSYSEEGIEDKPNGMASVAINHFKCLCSGLRALAPIMGRATCYLKYSSGGNWK